MHRLSSLRISSSSSSPMSNDVDDTESKVSTLAKVEEALVPPSLKIKRVDHYYSRWKKGWKYRNTSSKITIEHVPAVKTGDNDPWKDYLFVVVRVIPSQQSVANTLLPPTFKIVVKSDYILKACKDVIKSWPGVSWNSDPLELDPEIFITFLDDFHEYRNKLIEKKNKSDLDNYVLSSVDVLISSIEADYKNVLKAIRHMTLHREITYELLYSILVPRQILFTRCAITGQPRLFRLISWARRFDGYALSCESIDLVDNAMSQSVSVREVSTTLLIRTFKGTISMDKLDVYPLRFHKDATAVKELLAIRGRKWLTLLGVHHKQFNGIAAIRGEKTVSRHSVKGRIMIDRAAFYKLNPNYKFPVPATEAGHDDQVEPPPPPIRQGLHGLSLPAPPVQNNEYANDTLVARNTLEEANNVDLDLTDEDILLTSTVVYGFSLSDKLWLEFDVSKVEEVDWNKDAFDNLVLPTNHKSLLKSLVESHHHELGFDDFIRGKGHGLVVNLFGPPGVGKTFSAEATSEHVQRPLYLVGASDLGTDASSLDLALEKVFEVATAWKAIVLIDEADVFLEQRSLHDLERNAMVAVFLRHIEYYRGILFLTTNRVKAFDEAFLSRIHVALHFHELSEDSKVQVWTAFIERLGESAAITSEEIRILASRDNNGRQIKNAVRTAHSLARGRGEKVTYIHFMHTLDAMNDFTKEFQSIQEQN